MLPANGVPGAPSAHRGSPGLTSRHRRALTHLPLLKRAWGRNVHSRIGSGMCKIARDGRLGCANERVPRPEAWGFQLFGAASRTRTTRGGLPSPSRGRQTPWPSVPRATPRRRTTTKTEAQKGASVSFTALRPSASDVDVLGFGQEQEPDNKAHGGHYHRIPKARVDIAGSGDNGKHGRWQEASEPAVTDMVGQ